jgi:hypothetical protein
MPSIEEDGVKRRHAAAGAVLAVLLVGGLDTSAAVAAPYPPPATGAGKAAPERVKQGKCTTFSGDGFAASSRIEVFDGQTRYGTTTSGKNGDFLSRVCFANDAEVGQHVLRADGANAKTLPTEPDQREVTATVTVVGVEQTDPQLDSNNAASTTGTDVVSPFTLAALGLLLLPAFSGLLLLFERRHRRRRRAA